MNIMIIPTGFPSPENKATMLFVYEQAKALALCGENITVLHVQRQPSSAIFKRIDNAVSVHDEDYGKRYFTRLKTFGMHVFPQINMVAFVNKMQRLFDYAWENGERPDVIYAHFSCWAGVAAIKIGQKYNIPVVTIEHYSGFMENKIEKSYKKGLTDTVKFSQRFLTVSENLRQAVINLTGTVKDITVVPNMIDDKFVFYPLENHNPFRFCTLGHLSHRKRILFLVECFCKAFDANSPVELLVGGAGDEGTNIKELINKLGRDKQIMMLGKLTREESVELYKRSNCFVLPSSAETFGLVYREAMGVGRPVITTNHGGWSSSDWSDGFGIMIEVDDEVGLISALKKMVGSYVNYNQREISEYTHNHYDGKIIASQLCEIFQEVRDEYHASR